jgi:hypothetical protein
MKNILLNLFSLLLVGVVIFTACEKTEESDSTPQQVSSPFIYESFLESAYIYSAGNTNVYADIPDVVGIAVDTVYGFEGGYGGVTGMDTIKLLKSELTFGDTVALGGSTFFVRKYNKGNYRVTLSSNVVIAAANTNPGPTDLEGNYARVIPTANGYILEVKKVSDGVYLIFNPGGAPTVPANPYLLYNFKASNGADSLSFANQTDLCGGGLQLVNPAAPSGLVSSDYSASHPPVYIPAAPPAPARLTWRIYEFPSASTTVLHPGVALCNWGLGIRGFDKQ